MPQDPRWPGPGAGARRQEWRGRTPRETAHLEAALSHHVPGDPHEAASLDRARQFVRQHATPFDRRIRQGHLTGSAVVVAVGGERVLLVRHRKLGMWLQPGGHARADESSGEVIALREAREETGLSNLTLHPEAPRPFDVDVHAVPSRDGEPAHEHLDLRYLVVAARDLPPVAQQAEVADARWVLWSDLTAMGLDAGLLRALGKARAWMVGRD